MFAKHTWRVLAVLTLSTGSVLTTKHVLALGTPQIVGIDPNGSAQIGATITIHATVVWDSDFRSMRICINDWCQEEATPDFSKQFNSGGLSPGNHRIYAQAAKINEGWETATTSSVVDYLLTSSAPPAQEPPPQQNNPSQPSKGPTANVSFDPGGGAQVGGEVNIHVKVNSDNPGATKLSVNCGNLSKYETSEREFDSTWYTKACMGGTVNIGVCSKASDDPNWQNPTCNWYQYSLSTQDQNNPPPAERNPNDYFHNGNLIKTSSNGRVYVIIKEGSAIQRRWIPNPETLDALGMAQSNVDNKGFTERELLKLGQGSDVPDVIRDPEGFRTFKATFFPNLQPIVPGQQNQGNQQGQAQQGQEYTGSQLPEGVFDPHAPGVCQGWETRLWIGAYARITGPGGGLKLRYGPSTGDGWSSKMPSGYKFTVIGGPTCAGGHTWWNIQGDLGTGWAAEQGDDNTQTYWFIAPMTDPPASPPSTPIPQVGSYTEQVGPNPLSDISGSCQDLAGGQWWNPFNPPNVGASEQCTNFVQRTVQAVKECWNSAFPRAGLWDNWASDPIKSGGCGWTVTPADSNGLSSASPGDIIVWNGTDENGGRICSGADPAGHVAVFREANSDGTVKMNDSNSSYNKEKTKIDPTCMSIIRIGSQNQPTTNQTDSGSQTNQHNSENTPPKKSLLKRFVDWLSGLIK